ncbi:transcriptional regulator, putative [Theileria equi strain WA]|uniref:FACT complex subunit n=1 Tax=Theileria equi strain WA TaxID=1537102 RepID=L0B0X3_THEEQ|nr:transcriptional regulator, putative [Theileria equi strain WA]AFZ81168.1 transcriptional regulator, putative [Theileria equi strain WA]|eukprot:XP_004830834.1 transcriptional regulator, putative [Theileria equi strain WA]
MADSKRNVSINFEEVSIKLKKLAGIFKKFENERLDVIFVCTGKTQSDANATSSEMLQLWLTGFQFPETLFALKPSGIWFILTSPKKASYLEPVSKHYEDVRILHRVPGQTDEESLKKIFEDTSDPVIGVLNGPKPIGEFAEYCMKYIEGKQTKDISKEISSLMAVRTKVELEIQKQSAHLACGVMKSLLINQIENILDSETKTPHSSIVSQALEIHNDAKFIEKMEKKFSMNKNDMEIIYGNVQSGKNFSLTIGVKPTDDHLSHDPGSIIVSVCSKYSELCACLTRTLILDGTAHHKDVYKFAVRVFEFALTKLKPGVTFGSIYRNVYDFVRKEKDGYENNMMRTLGHTIGIEFKDANFTIIDGNESCIIEEDMVFHISVGFNNLGEGSGNFAIWIGDTVHVAPSGANVLTSSVSKGLENISYELEDEEEDDEDAKDEVEDKEKKPVVSSQILKDADSVILKERLRSRGGPQTTEDHDKMVEKQKELRNKKIEEISNRLKDGGGLGGGNKQKEVIKMDKIRAFSSPDSFSKELVPHKIYVDGRNDVVMLPINGYHLPFSVMIIKNVTCTPEENNNVHTLRINFQVPGSHTYTSRNEVNPLPDLPQENSIFIKEVLYKSKDAKHIQNVFRSIKELIKQMKQRESDDSTLTLADQEKLTLNKTGRRVVLKDLMVRPNIHGSRRIIGFLEAHHNGLRYIVNTRDRVDNVDITYSNIRHAIFQPCDRELIVLLHFHLKHPIVVGKRKTLDIQFYCEVGTQIDDLDNRRGRSYNDPDETLEEMRERELKRKLNSDFKNFVSQIREFSSISIDLPYRELMFTGVPLKSNVELLPTANCLVHLVEWPPFVLSLNDIEIVSLERVQHGLRNFDMVFVNKDYSKPVKRVDLIPVEYLDVIKRWLNELEIVWYEGKNNLQWVNILKTILEDAEAFVENGGFEGFLGEDDEEEESVDDETDEEYNAEDSEEEAENDDDEEYSDGDDESLADEDEDEEEYVDDEDDDEGLSWDELEERAKKADDKTSFDDSRNAKRRK